MSVVAILGGIGVGLQVGRGTAQSSVNYTPATNIDLNFEQDAQPYPFEVGGDYWQKNAYKRSVHGQGGFSALVRPNSIGYLLQAHLGSAQTSTGGDGEHTHIFTARTTSNGAWLGDGMQPWVTLLKNAGGLMAEQHSDARNRRLRLAVPAANIATVDAEFIAMTPKEISVPGSMSFDNELAFTTCTGVVSLGGAAAKATNINIDLQAMLSDDEFSVGNYFLDDITLLGRQAAISFEVILRDATLWRQVYRNGAGTVGTGAWDPAVFTGELSVNLLTASAMTGTTTTKGSLTLVIPKMNYLAFPIGLRGNELVRVGLRGSLTQPGTSIPLTATLVNTVTSY